MIVTPCANPVHHRPSYAYTDAHHKIPKSWGGPTTAENLIHLCQNCHHAIHWLIDEALKQDGVPELRHLSVYVRELARYAWVHRPEHPTPTLTVEHW